jgi:CubicO group peptidase (beta-lactamase class C family)
MLEFPVNRKHFARLAVQMGGNHLFNIQDLEHQIQEEMKASNVPGLSIAVVKNEEVIYAGGFGVTNAEEGGTRVTPDTLFRVGSISNLITGTLIMRLVEQGNIDLDTPVQRYVPWFTLSDPDAAKTVTMRMLLTHTAGFVNTASYMGSRDPEGLRSYVRDVISKEKLYSKPGELFNYNCASFDIAGLVAEEVTGKHFADLVQKLVLEPLGMNRTTYDPLVAMTYPLALPHKAAEDGSLQVLHQMPEHAAHYPSFYLMTSANDLIRFAQMHLNAGMFDGRQVLRPESVQEMHRMQVKLQSTTGYGVGLSFFMVQRKGVWVLNHFGDITTYSANIYIVPDEGVAAVIMNSRPFPHHKVMTKVFDQLLPDRSTSVAVPETPEADRSAWAAFEGAYIGGTAGLAVVEREGEELKLTLNGKILTLRPFQDQYAAYDAEGELANLVRFVPNGGDPCQYVMIDNVRCHRFDYDSSFTPDPKWLEAYQGVYAHDKYLGPYRIFLEDGQLLIEELNYGNPLKDRLLPVSEHLFVGPYAKVVEFQVAEDGSVPSFIGMFGWKMDRL